ncbi:MAG TPA: GNAT family N-acetyltransferase [Candidatus Acidoferrales bacterium]|nr:GNAT family N-acetyltransferase [Candidatus Acidoferrales bacterium]
MILSTPRLTLRSWREADREPFAAMHFDAEVTRDLGGVFERARSDAKLDRYMAAFESHGFCRWAIHDASGKFLGYAGIMPSGSDHPLGRHVDIGWRLVRSAWGQGIATEAAGAALRDAFTRVGLTEVLAYTDPDNLRSQAVMARLNLVRDSVRDFTLPGSGWRGLVWVARSIR